MLSTVGSEITPRSSTSQNSAILRADLGRDFVVGAAEDDVGLDAGAAQLAHGVLRRLRLDLVRRADVRQERHVDRERVLGALFAADLADGLEERLALDVADGAADLDDHHLRAGLAADAAARAP